MEWNKTGEGSMKKRATYCFVDILVSYIALHTKWRRYARVYKMSSLFYFKRTRLYKKRNVYLSSINRTIYFPLGYIELFIFKMSSHGKSSLTYPLAFLDVLSSITSYIWFFFIKNFLVELWQPLLVASIWFYQLYIYFY